MADSADRIQTEPMIPLQEPLAPARESRTRPVLGEQPIEAPPDDRSLAWVGLLTTAGVFNFLFVPMMRGADGAWPLVAIGTGVFAAELGLATLWLVWGPGSFGLRLVAHWAAAIGLYCCFAVGVVLALADQVPAQHLPPILFAILCGMPAVSLAAQLPLWPLRTHLGWRIERQPENSPAEHIIHSLSIRDMIFATVVTSLSLACLRFIAMLPNTADAWFWPTWGIAVAIIAVVSTLSLLPATLIVFRIRDKSAAAAALGGYALVAWVCTCIILSATAAAAGGGAAPAEFYLAILACYGSFAFTLGLPLLVLASRGYRLTFPIERKSPDL
jgi:hypothetical protein